MSYKTISIYFIILGFISCKNLEKIKIITSRLNGFPEIIIQNKNLKMPFIIKGNKKTESGSFYFETNNGKTWIIGTPYKIIKSEDFYKAVQNSNKKSEESEKVKQPSPLNLNKALHIIDRCFSQDGMPAEALAKAGGGGGSRIGGRWLITQ